MASENGQNSVELAQAKVESQVAVGAKAKGCGRWRGCGGCGRWGGCGGCGGCGFGCGFPITYPYFPLVGGCGGCGVCGW